MESTGSGFLLLVVAGVMNASFALPMKFTKRWAWENTWAVWSALALLLMPLIAAVITIPRLSQVYAQAGTRSVVLVAICGMGWGIAQVLFGLVVDSIGIALAFAIVLGLSAATGSLIPFLQLHSDKVLTPAGLGLIGGVLLVVIGVGTCARAGMLRDQTAAQTQMTRSPTRGILMAIMSGIGAAAMNFGVAFGGPVVEAAATQGAKTAWRMNAVWLPLMTAGAVPNLLYCAYLMRSKRTSANFSVNGTGHYWLSASVMATFWFASTLMYGVASLKLGVLGPVYGWPFFMSLIVIVSSVIGILAGEWKNAAKYAVGLQLAGVGVLTAAMIVLSYAGRHL
ncbi:MAG TPA: L-rhamnose/proton symporter RhaT [Candidatus Acidoferrum sp.]